MEYINIILYILETRILLIFWRHQIVEIQNSFVWGDQVQEIVTPTRLLVKESPVKKVNFDVTNCFSFLFFSLNALSNGTFR